MDPLAPLNARQKLKMLGFSEHEITILTLLFLRKKLATKEVSQQTSLSFDTVHYTLNALEKRGLVSRKTDSGEDVIEVCSEKEFLDWIDNQQQKNTQVYTEAKNVLEGYLQAIGESNWKPDVMYFEGKQGLIDIYEDMLKTKKDIYCWTDIEAIHETIGDYMFDFIERRVKANIITHAILPKTAENIERQQDEEKRDVKLSDNLPIDGEIRIYGNKVAVITFEGKKPVGFVFSGELITDVFKAIFKHAWEKC